MRKPYSAPCRRLFRPAYLLALIACLASLSVTSASTIVVTNLADNGAGSLRSALTNAQNGDVITFAVAGVITNTSAELAITNSVALLGPGADVLAVSGNNLNRAFRIASGAAASLSGLAIRTCYAGPGMDGGGIYNGGTLALTNCVFSACRSTLGGVNMASGGSGVRGGNGGAIYSAGTLWAVSCLFLTNSALPGGSGTAGSGPGAPGGSGGNGGNGGAVYDAGTATFINCAFGWNNAGAGGAGGAGGHGYNTFYGPGGYGGGGGNGGYGSAVYSLGGPLFISCTIFSNAAGAGGGGGSGGYGYYATYPGNSGGYGGSGGGGALYCAGSPQLFACTFATNAAGRGGSGGAGGAGANNTLNGMGGMGGNGGAGGNGGLGGGICLAATNLAITLQNVLIAHNTAGGAGPAGSAGAGGSGTIPGPGGSSGTAGQAGAGPDLYGAFVSGGHNLIGLGAGCSGFTNNVLADIVGSNTSINAKIGALAFNGGAIWTCALQAGSPALNSGDNSILGAPLSLAGDARGYPRLSGSQVDIGAYEHQWATTPVSLSSALAVGGVQLSATNIPGAYFSVLASTSLSSSVSNWPVVGQMIETSPGRFLWTDASFTNRSLRFFRLRSP